MLRVLSLFAASALLGITIGARAEPAAAPHAAACVAALRAEEKTLARAVKAGDPVGGELLKVVRSGIAIIGTQYLAGLREADARRLLKAAEEDFRTLSPADAAERQAQCLREGHAIYEHASPLEQSLISTAAQRRIRKLTAT